MQAGPPSPNPDAPPAFHHRRGPSDLASRIADGLALGSDDDLFRAYLDVDNIAALSTDDCCQEEEPNTATAGHGGRTRHRYSSSVDGCSVTSAGDVVLEPKRAMSSDQLAVLAVVDPKRAKRIVANRQSAARSKERKARYISELQRRLQILQMEATTLSAQLSLFQRDTTGLSKENEDLRLQLQAMEQQVQLCDATNKALSQEVETLRIATREIAGTAETYIGLQNTVYNNQPFVAHSRQQQQASIFLLSDSDTADFGPPANADPSLSKIMIPDEEDLGGLLVLDINKDSFFMRSGSSLSASESCSNF